MYNKLFILAFCLLSLPLTVNAAETEIVTEPIQTIEVDSAGGAVVIQKQPANTPQKQVIRIKKSGGFLLVQINGKVKATKTEKE